MTLRKRLPLAILLATVALPAMALAQEADGRLFHAPLDADAVATQAEGIAPPLFIDNVDFVADGAQAGAARAAALVPAATVVFRGGRDPVAPPPAPRAPAPEAEPVASGGNAPPQTIRVTVEVLEGLMMLVSELVLTRNQLLQLSRNGADSAFAVPLQRLSHITSDLQEGVMKTRMQPIGNAWAKLPRLVRDLGVELGKKIELVMRGADTELDRQVLELIKDPLTHMVRNSADHGLETAEGRRAAGKPEQGRIRLNAFHEGGHIVIEIG